MYDLLSYSPTRYIAAICLCFWISVSGSQVITKSCADHRHSHRLANYVMEATLDTDVHAVKGTQQITWTNHSPDPVDEIMMYMYLNAFKSTKSSYFRGSSRWDPAMADRPDEEWGRVDLISIVDSRDDIELPYEYVADIDNNPHDETALRLTLSTAVLPGESVTLETQFYSKLPRLFVRSGYAEGGFCHFVHWYPKLGVYEQDIDGRWGWNCHQFVPGMEFYGEFGTYDMTIHAPSDLIIGASGCRLAMDDRGDVTTHRFLARDVIDFAWVVYDDFDVSYDRWEHVEIELLSPPSHHLLYDRLIGAVKHSLAYMTEHVGPFPYDKITVMDPPVHAMRSGFMEYPTYITGGSFFAFPPQITSMESLIVHEFCHQYFMGIVATNEKEAPWLDEGFVTFFEDQVMETYYGGGSKSLMDICGVTLGNSALTRSEYVGMDDPTIDAVATPGYELKGPYKSIIYSKTATVLRTIMHWMGEDTFYDMMRCYYDTYKFTHPRAEEFFSILFPYAESMMDDAEFTQFKEFVHDAIYETKVCDYAVRSIDTEYDEDRGQYRSLIAVENLGDMSAPVEIRITSDAGDDLRFSWDGIGSNHTVELYTIGDAISVMIDPAMHVPLDLNRINNSLSTQKSHAAGIKYANRGLYWIQNIMQSLSFVF